MTDAAFVPDSVRSTGQALLSLQGISKRFGGVQALTEVSLTIPEGAIYGLIGPNGAGKTTLFNVITGFYQADAGRRSFAGHDLPLRLKASAIVERGIARTFQNIRLFHVMTALENVMVGRHRCTRTGLLAALLNTRAAREEEAAIARRARELLDYVGLPASAAGRLANELSYGDQRRLEIARALATEPRLLALDEPAAGMNGTEKVELRALIERIRAVEARSYDIEALSRQFGTSFEQVAHRLTTLNKPGMLRIPFFFIRVDRAGNVSKRHSATDFHFSQVGGSCPLWIVYEAFNQPGRILTQTARMPDGRRHFWLARQVSSGPVGHGQPRKTFAVALGCDLQHAERLVYSLGLDVQSPGNSVSIGPGCRVCPREDCMQRAFAQLPGR